MSTAPTNLPAVRAPQGERPLSAWLKVSATHELIASALGNVMPADQFIAHALVSFQDPKIAACTTQSKIEAVMAMAALGLLPTLGQCAIIPYDGVAKVMPQWQGYKAVMERHPAVLEVEPVLVHVNDHFTYVNGVVQHSFDPFDATRTINSAADIRGGYVRITYRDGRPPKYHFVAVAKIEKAQKCAKGQNIWKAWWAEMATKTLLRDTYARRAVPVDPMTAGRLEQFTHADDVVLGNDPQRVLDADPAPDSRKPSKAEQLFGPAKTAEPPITNGVNDYVAPEGEIDPAEDTTVTTPDEEQPPAETGSQESAPLSVNPEANAAWELDVRERWTPVVAACTSVSTGPSSIAVFNTSVIPGAPENERPIMLEMAAARTIMLATTIPVVAKIKAKFPQLAELADAKIEALNAAKANANEGGRV